MLKIEIIWREMLWQAIEQRKRQFTQKELAGKFGFSTSTIFQALKIPRKMGAVRVTGRYFTLEDSDKLLYHWASVRNFKKEIIFAGRVNLPVLEIEGLMPPNVIFGCYSAAGHYLAAAPADYDKVYVYRKIKNHFSQENLLKASKSKIKNTNEISKILEKFRERFVFTKGSPNLFVLAGDEFLDSYGGKTTLAQTFVDLWNLPEWYAREYTRALKAKIDELLS